MSISIPGADYTPQLTGYTGQGAFRFWCQKVLPIVYDDSLSYYELLNKVVNYLNNVIADVASVEDNVGELNKSYGLLQTYVNEHMQEIVDVVNQYTEYTDNYFNNLDVQEEINNKLDEMVSDGSLSTLIGPIVVATAPDVIAQWLSDHITPTTPIVDNTLTISGAAADAKVTGEAVANLNSEVGRRMYGVPTFTELAPTQTESGKAWNGSSLDSISGYTAYKCSVTPGNVMKFIGCQPSVTYLLYSFYDSDDTLVSSSFYNVAVGPGKKEAVNVVVPADASYCWVNTFQQTDPPAYTTVYDNDPENFKQTVEADCLSSAKEEIETATSIKMDAISIYTEQTPSETEVGYLWGNNKLEENSYYTAYKYSVAPGDILRVVGCQPSSTNLLFRIYNSNDNLIATSISDVETSPGEKEFVFTVPENASYMWINTNNSYSDNGAYSVQYDTNPYHIPEQVIHVSVGTTGATFEANGFKYIIRKVGANNLVNIYAGYYNDTLLFATQTDWIGPYQFTKDSDAHGDLNSATTGGNHSITDGTNTATTARTISFEVLGDGAVLSKGDYFVKNASIRWVNEVMAGNTCKYDGTGEYCLEEHCNIEVTIEGVLNVEHWFKPYYDCTLKWYSGMQFAGQGFAPNIYIPEYLAGYMTTGDINTNSNLCEVDRILAVGSTVSLDMHLDRTYGMGAHTLKAQVTGNATKAYFVLQSANDEPMPIVANGIYAWRGSYRFFKSY